MSSGKPRLHVAVAVIQDAAGNILLAKRHPDSHQGGLWEFPGGKCEDGEGVYQALARELHEELSVIVSGARPLIRIPYDYPDRRVLLDVWRVTAYEEEPMGREGQQIEWVNPDRLSLYPMPQANLPIVSALSLPDKYLITPEPGQTRAEWKVFLEHLVTKLSAGTELVQFRAKSLDAAQYAELAREVMSVCHDSGCRVIQNISQENSVLADADGLHMSSMLLMRQRERLIDDSKLLSASCHTLAELRHANKIGCDFVVLGPVKQTVSHPDVIPLGWEMFAELCDESMIPVYALGGMTPGDLTDAWRHGAQGVSGISAFWNE